MRFVIIGGDAAGMSAASRAKRRNPELEVVVLEKTNDVSYSACGMPYNIADPQRSIEELVVRQADVFREKNHIDLRTGHLAKRIDRQKKCVEGENHEGATFSIKYDNLLIGTGASPAVPPIEGIEMEGVMVLKSLGDGRNIKTFVSKKNVKKAVIIGMGYIALEMAEALHALGIEVNMVKPRAELLPWMNRDLAEIVKKEIEGHGVGIHTGNEINHVEINHKDSLKVSCSNVTLDGQMVLVAVGVTPNSQLAEEAGLELGPFNSIAIDRCARTSDPHIYAAGDCADSYHVVTGKKTWVPLALRANRAGWAVADNIAGKKIEMEGIAGTAVFKVFNLQVARTGLSQKEAESAGFDPVEIVIKSRSRAHAHPGSTDIWVQMIGDKKSGRLLGMQLLGAEGAAHRINAAAVALHNRMTVEAFSQCDMAYAPPFGPVWDPMLTASNQLLKKI
jgi:NADPH-dependent 2,4-dienoyl-CoA reductase/sulfur reductase-like enzyme